MKPKERVLTALNWQKSDRVPIQVYLTPEMEIKLTDYFKGKNILECLGIDFRYVRPIYRGKIRKSHDSITYDMCAGNL
ncbi:MAG: hypothetical protein L3J71_08775 [Victivallaceae bacterium]|nr:hypothetical protein [Victivallaceae bacterium]